MDYLVHRAEELLNYSSTVSAYLQDVQFHGVVGTKFHALRKEVSELYNSRTLDELVRNSYLAAQHMQEVGLFDKCLPVIDTSRADRESYTVNFYVKEPGAFHCGIKGGMTFSGDAEVSLQGMKKSALGAGEMGSMTYTKTLKGGHSFDLTAAKPLLGWQKYSNICASLSRRFDWLQWNKADVTQNNFVAEYNERYFDNKIKHSLRLYTSWRCFEPKADASFQVREHAGHTSKISLENIVAYDTRDRPLLATRGILARISNEYAGLLGDAAFLKNHFELQMATTLPFGLIFGASGKAAMVDGLAGPVGRNIHLLDRIYLGGPYDVRGFQLNSLGTRIDGSSLGGAFGLAGAIHLYRSLVPVNKLFAHIFMTGGGISSVRSRNRLGDALDNPRVTAGLGITFVYNNLIRLEMNYVHPVRIVNGDTCAPGIQFGAGINFL